VATIAVEVPAGSATAEQAEALLRACNVAAAPDRCETAGATSETPAAFAVVSWQGELAVHVEVGHPGADGWLERRIIFAPEDPALERWQAVGYAIGTLYGATEKKSAAPAPTLTPEQASPAKPKQTERAPVARKPKVPPAHTLAVELMGRAGTGTESSARFGAGVGLFARHKAGPFLSTDVNLDLTDAVVGPDATALSVRFVTVGMSLGTGLPLATNLRLDLGAGPLLEYQWLWTELSPAAESRVVGGVRGGATVAYRVGRRVWLGIGAQMGSRFGDATITVDGERVDSIPHVFASATLTLGFDVWRSQAGAGK